ncbi:digestive cysteine proteinase 2-like [Clytia hemisphaerica]|uniref:Cathepsin L n=1 Tax=Clytia hemisphaerica TaxID=252671 RepID=A0A7M5XAA1_9CNID
MEAIFFKLVWVSILIGCIGGFFKDAESANPPAAAYKLRIPDKAWKNWAQKFEKKYKDEKEEKKRFQIWKQNAKYAVNFNRKQDKEPGNNKMKLKMNKFGDLTNEEYRKFYLNSKLQSYVRPRNIKQRKPQRKRRSTTTVEKDWRDEGKVTPVKDQGSCGSCWAFSTTGTIESHYAIKHGPLIPLSEQQLVDCSTENSGCNGGVVQWAYDYVKEKTDGLESGYQYPYEAIDNNCRYDHSKAKVTISGYEDIPFANETKQVAALNDHGPISVCIDAGHLSFQFYSSGVYYEPNCNQNSINHAVIAVGFGSEGGSDYWIIKNSWGTGWGDGGYMKVSRNQNNHCGIATQSCYPII